MTEADPLPDDPQLTRHSATAAEAVAAAGRAASSSRAAADRSSAARDMLRHRQQKALAAKLRLADIQQRTVARLDTSGR